MIWNPEAIAFNIFGLSIAWYGLSWSLAILIGYFIFLYIFKRESKDLNKLVPFIQYVFVGTMIGARFFEMIYYQFDFFIQDPLLFFRFRQGGLSSHGAMIGTIIAIYIFVKRNKEFTFFWLLDRSVIVVLTQGAIVRLGNFFNSELYGKITDVPWAVNFIQIDSYYRHPVQIYEFLWLMTCFIAFFVMYLKHTKNKDSFFTALFLIIVLGGRVVLEFFKEADIYFLFFSKTQLISLVYILFGIYLLSRPDNRNVKN